MINYVLAAVLFLIVGGAFGYIIKEKKKGTVCIGCPHAGACTNKNKEGTSCKCH